MAARGPGQTARAGLARGGADGFEPVGFDDARRQFAVSRAAARAARDPPRGADD
jgi:hypothetical protein